MPERTRVKIGKLGPFAMSWAQLKALSKGKTIYTEETIINGPRLGG